MPADRPPAGWPPLPPALPEPVVDSHCHLDHARAGGTPPPVEQALALAAAVGVRRVVQIGCDLPSARWSVQVAGEQDALVTAVGLHPNEAPRLAGEAGLADALAEVEQLAAGSDRVRGVGETGLDYFRTPPAGRAAQLDSFERQVEMARRHNRTLVIHDRDAHADVLALLRRVGPPNRTVMHCFSGDADVARAGLDLGAYLSFAGTVTFGNAEPVRAALRVTPLDRVLVETDAPYLTPAPHRGQPNASYLMPHTVRAMAEVGGWELAELCQALAGNAEKAFGGPW